MSKQNSRELFELVSSYKPTGDQPQAIAKLVDGIKKGDKEQTLLGVTGSGKTFTMANIIAQVQKPTLVLAHNKTLAADVYKRQVLRRYNKSQTQLVLEDVTIDIEARSVIKNGISVELTPKEFDLLLMLARNKNTVLYRETLFERVWGEEFMGNTRTLDLHIQRLRKKLSWQDKIKTVYRIGYKLEVES